jgi:hypothetical protein
MVTSRASGEHQYMPALILIAAAVALAIGLGLLVGSATS